MSTDGTGASQLQTIGWLNTIFGEREIDYWLFGGWAVDFHASRVTRDHQDIDIAIWHADLERISALLKAHGWVHVPEPDEDGYTGYERGDIRLELAFLASDEIGIVFTPLVKGRGDWPVGAFGDTQAEVGGVRARVIGLTSLIEDKSGPRNDPVVIAKDQADVAVLTSLHANEEAHAGTGTAPTERVTPIKSSGVHP